jgi:hypothetical protein
VLFLNAAEIAAEGCMMPQVLLQQIEESRISASLLLAAGGGDHYGTDAAAESECGSDVALAVAVGGDYHELVRWIEARQGALDVWDPFLMENSDEQTQSGSPLARISI